MRMDPGLDTGPVYARAATEIGPGDTAPAVTERLATLGAELLMEVVRSVELGTATATAQDDGAATYAPRLGRDDGLVDWSTLSAVEVDRRVRGLQPWPGVTAPLAGLMVRILAGGPAGAVAVDAAAGSVLGVHGEAAEVATAAGVYSVAAVQPAGGRPMSAAAYLRGRRLGGAP
jgi:methionyl-tRNA formyltransferase